MISKIIIDYNTNNMALNHNIYLVNYSVIFNRWIFVWLINMKKWAIAMTFHKVFFIADICPNHTTGGGVLFFGLVFFLLHRKHVILARFGYFFANLHTFWFIFYKPRYCDGEPKWTNMRYGFNYVKLFAI